MVHCVGRWWIQKGRRFYYIWSGKFCVICFNHGADDMIFEIKDELKQKSVEFKEELNKRLLAIGYFLLLLLYYIMARISSCFTQWITCRCGSWKELLKLNHTSMSVSVAKSVWIELIKCIKISSWEFKYVLCFTWFTNDS